MRDDFLWLKPKYVVRISFAIMRAETAVERDQLYRLLYRGLFEWGVKVSVVLMLVMSVFLLEDTSKTVLVELTNTLSTLR